MSGLMVILTRIAGVTDKGLLDQPFAFQCPPTDQFEIEYAHSHQDYDTVSAGQFSRKGGLQLRKATFDTLFVDYGLYTHFNDEYVEDMTAALIELTESGSPFLFTAAHQLWIGPQQFANPKLMSQAWSMTLTGPEAQWPATLRDIRLAEKAGEGDARYASASFVEYRDPVVNLFERVKGKRKRPGAAPFPRTVTMGKDGKGVTDKGYKLDRQLTLANLAQSFYGSSAGARLIAKENSVEDWGFNTPLIQRLGWTKGGKIIIPRPYDQAVVSR